MNTAITTERWNGRRTLALWLLLAMLLTAGKLPAQNIARPNIEGPAGLQVNSYTGSLCYQRTDLLVPGRGLSLNGTFTYNSSERARDGGYGFGWTFAYNIFYTLTDTSAIIYQADGRRDYYKKEGNNYKAQIGIFDKLTNEADSKLKLRTKEGIEYYFDDATHKKLTSIVDRNGNTITLAYNNGILSTVTDASGRKMQLIWEKSRVVELKADFSGSVRSIHYTYDTTGLLKSVKDPLNNSVYYTYIRGRLMDTYTDLNGNVHHILYNSNNAVSKFVSCDVEKSISYNIAELKTYVTDHNNDQTTVTIYAFDKWARLISQSGNCCGYNTSFQYDGYNNINQRTDANRHTTIYTYDANGNVLSETDPLNQTILYTYESNFNRLSSVTDKRGNTRRYIYDAKGNLLQLQEPLNQVTKFTYDAHGNKKDMTYPGGQQILYTYDNYGNLSTVTDALGAVTTYTYDIWGNRVTIKDAKNNTFTRTYDAGNRLLTIDRPLGNKTTYTYDPIGNLLTVKDGNNNTTTYTYDARNLQLAATDALSQMALRQYDAAGNLVALTDKGGNKTLFAYDTRGRKIAETNPAGETTRYEYDNNGNITAIGLPNSNTIRIKYDALNRPLEATDDRGLLMSVQYDANGNRIMETDAKGNTITQQYNALNRITGRTDALGNTFSREYDANGNVITEKDKNNNAAIGVYDQMNQLVRKTDAEGHVNTYTYDGLGKVTSVKDAKGNTTTYTYDALGRTSQELFADNTTRTYAFDAAGNMLSAKDNNGQQTTYVYDKLNRPVTRQHADGVDSFRYDANGYLIRARNSAAVVTFSYDKAYRLSAETLNGKATGYAWDIVNNIRRITYPGGRIIEQTMDARSQLSAIREGAKTIATFEYNNADELSGRRYANGTNTVFQYSSNKQVTKLVVNPGQILELEYTYDKDGNQLTGTVAQQPAFSEQLTYDRTGQITKYQTNNNRQITYQYDGVGNRTSMQENSTITAYTTNAVNAYTNIGSGAGSQMTFDANGNMKSKGSRTFTYNNENKLTAVDGGTTAAYRYDALGRRIQKTIGTRVVNYYFDGFQVIEERNEEDSLLAVYTWGVWLDDLVAMQKNRQTYYYHANATGSVVAVTDSAGAVAERYTYDAFGKVTFLNKDYTPIAQSAIGNNYLFTGRELDAETGNYYYRARQYDPIQGRFLQKDPLNYIDGLCDYKYALNNPARYIDPLGTFSICPKLKIDPKKIVDYEKIAKATKEAYKQAYEDVKHLKGTVSKEELDRKYEEAAYDNIVMMRHNNPTDVNLAAADHYIVASSASTDKDLGKVNGAAVTLFAAGYDIIKTYAFIYQVERFLQADDKPISPPTFASFVKGVEGGLRGIFDMPAEGLSFEDFEREEQGNKHLY